MTLREKIKEEKVYINPYYFKLTEDSAVRFEQIAEEFAIGFAEWVLDRFTFKDFIHKEPKELLEIYKKEKGL